MKTIFFWLGLGCLMYCGYLAGMERLNQSYDNWIFEQHIAGRKNATVADYLREETPLSLLVKDAEPTAPPAATTAPREMPPNVIEPNALLGKIEIGRLHLSAMVREGVDAQILSTSVGHVPSTALPGHDGNFALAAHRDTLFRALKDIRVGDLVTFVTQEKTFTYRVRTTSIVKPSDVSVLRSEGQEELTLITCYPFYYVGSAPKRFIVQARLVPETEVATR